MTPALRTVLSGVNDTDATAWAMACTVPPTANRFRRTRRLIRELKLDVIWLTLDRLPIFAALTQQAALVDVRNPTKSLTIAGSVTFTIDRGFAGDLSTGYIDFGELATAAGNSYAQDSACFGFWLNTDGTTGGQRNFGILSSNTPMFGVARNDAGNETFNVNDATSSTLQSNQGTKVGHRGYSRTGATTKRGFYNGVRVADLPTASTGVPASNTTALKSNNTYSDARMAACYQGGGLDDTAMGSLHTRLSTFLTAIGAN